MCDQAAQLGDPRPNPPDLIVWPETTYLYDWIELKEGAKDELRGETSARIESEPSTHLALREKTNILLGLNTHHSGEGRKKHD